MRGFESLFLRQKCLRFVLRHFLFRESVLKLKFKFIHSKKGYGKTSYIFESIKNLVDKQEEIIILVPRNNTFMIENRLLSFFGESIFSKVKVMDFEKLIEKILRIYKGTIKNKISVIGKNLLVKYILRNNNLNLKYFNSNLDVFLDEILSLLVDFKELNFTNDKIQNIMYGLNKNDILYKKLYDLKLINELYEKYLNEKYLDPLDEMKIVNSIIKNEKSIFSKCIFYIDGFEVFNYYQYDFLKIIIQRVREINFSLTFEKDNPLYSHIQDTKNRVLDILFNKGIYDIDEIFLENTEKSFELKYLDNNYLSFEIVPFKEAPRDIFINKSINNFDEIQEVCKNIRKLLYYKGYKYRDIGILCRDIDSYENLIRVSFDEFDIPYFIDKKNDINSNVFVIFFTSIFEIFEHNFSYLALFKYIKSGFINVTYDEIFMIENFAIENGIMGNKWKNPFKDTSKVKYSIDKSPVDLRNLLEEINLIREKIVSPLVKFFEKVEKNNKASYFVKVIYNFLEENSVLHRLHEIGNRLNIEKKFAEANELTQILNSIFGIFDEIIEIFNDEIMSFSEFGKIIKDSIKKIKIDHVHTRLDEVIIGDITKMVVDDYKVLFVIGCVSNSFPKSYKTEEVLTDLDKKYLRDNNVEMKTSNRDKNLLERYAMYSLINIPTERIYISYPMCDMENLQLSPSIMIKKIKRIFPLLIEKSPSKEFKLEDISTKKNTLNDLILKIRDCFDDYKFNDTIISLCKFYSDDSECKDDFRKFLDNLNFKNSCDKLNKNLVKYLYKNMDISISSIESYSKCPFKYFVDYILRAKTRRVYSFESLDYGNFMHFLMENILKGIKDLNFNDISKREIEERVNAYDLNVFSDDNGNYILNTNSKFRIFGNKMKKIVSDSVFHIISHLVNSKFYHKFYEFEIGKENYKVKLDIGNEQMVNFVGKVDRIDFYENEEEIFVNVIDYKSSVRKINYGSIYQSLNIQTLAYMKYILEIFERIYNKTIVPCGVFYFILQNLNVKDKQNLNLEDEIYKNYKYDGIFINDLEKLKIIDKNLENDFSKILPIRVNKNGEISKNVSSDKLLTDEEFNILLEFVHDSIEEKIREIFKGIIDVRPILENSCDNKCINCNYIGICKFSKSINSFGVLLDLNKEDFFLLLEKGE